MRTLLFALLIATTFSANEARADDLMPDSGLYIIVRPGPTVAEQRAALEPLERKTRWFRGLALSTAAVALIGYAALPLEPDYPVFETFAGIAGAGTVLSAAFLGAWVASRFELHSAERALDGQLSSERNFRRLRRRRLLGTGSLLMFVGAALVVAGVVPESKGETAALARTAVLGSVGGGLAVAGAATGIRGLTLGEEPKVSLTVGLGSVGLTGTF